MTEDERASITNGIWLCQTCSRLIDADVTGHPTPLLLTWKKDAEANAREAIGKARAKVGGEPFPHHAAQLASLASSVQMLVQGIPGNSIDIELDDIKHELDRHQVALAEHLIDRLLLRHSDKLSDRQIWRVKTQLAHIRLSKGEMVSAGQLLLDAYELQPSDEKARVNRGAALEFMGNREEAFAWATSMRSEYPLSESALAVWIRTAPDDVEFDDLVAGSGTLAETGTEVTIALAMRALRSGKPQSACEYAEKSTHLDADAPQAWLQLGYATHNLGQIEFQVIVKRECRERAIEYYSRAAQLSVEQGFLPLQISALVNRGIVRELLELHRQADDDFRHAIRLAPEDAEVATQYALCLAGQNRQDEVLEQLERAYQIEPNPEREYLLAGALYDRNKGDDRERAVERWCSLAKAPSHEKSMTAVDSAVRGFCQFGKVSQAKELLAIIPAEQIGEVTRHALESRIFLALDNREKAVDAIRQALVELTGESTDEVRWQVAEMCARLKMYFEAVAALGLITRRPLFDFRSKLILDWANQAEDHGTVLRMCRDLRLAGIRDRHLSLNELDVLQHYGVYEASRLGQKHLEIYPEDKLVRLLVSVLGIKLNCPVLVATDSSLLPGPEEASPRTIGRLVITLLLHIGKAVDALKYAYESLRFFPGDPDANHGYIGLFFTADVSEWPLAPYPKVSLGSAVRVREIDSTNTEWLVVEDYKPQPLLREYGQEHPKIRAMLGKGVGDKFLLATGVKERWGEILDIKSKYLYRFEECRDKYQTEFPERHDFQMVQVVRRSSTGEEVLDLEPIKAGAAERRKHALHCVGVYQTHPVSLHTLANALGLDLFDTIDGLRESTNLQVTCSFDDDGERRRADYEFDNKTKLVLDVTALYSLSRLGLLEVVGAFTGIELLVSQHTVDHLADLAHENPRLRPFGHFVSEGENWGISEIPAEDVQTERRARRQLEDWARTRCTVTGSYEVAELEPTLRNQLLSAYGRDGLASMAIAARPGHVLWTDDLALAMMARRVFGERPRTWTQMALYTALRQKRLDSQAFNMASARLVGWQYSVTWFDLDAMTHAASLSSWSPAQWPFSQLLVALQKPGKDRQYRVETVAAFIWRVIWHTRSREIRQVMVSAVLSALPDRWWAVEVQEELVRLFRRNELERIEVLGLIRIWKTQSLGTRNTREQSG